MIAPQEVALVLYNTAFIPVMFFSVLYLFLAIFNILSEKEKKSYPDSKKLPIISVQIPVFNDSVATECIEKCMVFDYPKSKYEIIIVDDSTDKKIAARLKAYTKNNSGFIKYVHRNNREGFKPGALNNAMSVTRGEIIVIFDSDWKPGKGFLRDIIKPLMSDDKVAFVQAKQTFVNLRQTLVSRFAGYLLMIYHRILMPINDKVNSVFFCGTAGAIRRKALDEMGGWNASSITEDADLSIKMLSSGYKSVYMDIEVPSEVPETIEGFIKQQMRWCYGLTRAFFDNIHGISSSKKLSVPQKIVITYNTLGNIIAPIVFLMTFFGMVGWFLGDPRLFNLNDIIQFFLKFAYTSGFLLLGGIALFKEGYLKEFPYLVLGTFSVSLILVAFNSFAFFKAVMNRPLFWHCTPKSGNVRPAKHD